MTRIISADELHGLVGQELGVSGWFVIDQNRIDDFARVTQDAQWIHVDVERATAAAGGTIAHGLLTLSLLPAMGNGIWQLAGVASTLNYGFDRVRFTAAVPSGSRVRMRQTLGRLEQRPNGLLVVCHCVVEIEGGDRPALIADWLGLSRLG